jgi:hypothetical protein
LRLTDEEARHLRATIRNVARMYGSLSCLAEVLGVHPGVLTHRRRPSPGLALAVARAAGMTFDAVVGGKLTAAGRCPTCGTAAGAASRLGGGAP